MLVAGAVSEMLGHDGKTMVAVASGMFRKTVIKAETKSLLGLCHRRVLRVEDDGDKPLSEKQSGLLAAGPAVGSVVIRFVIRT